MSGFMMCVGACVACKVTITFNPNRVPSITVNGQREPVCRNCFARWNEIHRISKGLEPLLIHPDAFSPEPV